jgi:hypothetical protein
VKADDPSFGWAADPEAGKLIERYRGSGKPMPKSDPRVDVLIDIGILLGSEHDEMYYEQEKMLVARAVSAEYTQYTIHVDDGLVFSALYTEDLELGEYLNGPWVHRLAALAKGLRRGRKALIRAHT